jgi:ankyrin repeat protein
MKKFILFFGCIIAFSFGSILVIKFLNPGMKNNEINLIRLTNKGYKTIVNFFFPVDKEKSTKGMIPHMTAVERENLNITESPMVKGADARLKNRNGDTSLTLAVREGNINTVNVLLSRGVAINAKCKNGKTALMAAVIEGHLDIVKTLLDKGANIDAQNNDGQTALMEAVAGGHADIVMTLLEGGANVNLRNKKGWTALKITEVVKRRKIARLLDKAGAKK